MKRILIAVLALVSVAGFAQPKFAHVNSNELVQLMPESDQARATMASAQKEAQTTFEEMYKEYTTKAQQYQQNVGTWTQTVRELKEKELTQIQQSLEEFNQSIQQELAQKQQELMAPIQKKVNDTIQQLAKEGGYVFVFDVASLLYVDEAQSDNLTPKARTILGIPEGRTLESLYAELQAQQQNQQ
ncbi:MAG: OmpH family outer membrane protein [Bacteroidales bacterium]|nr:OmpH family outer membrane protein [Bacteroidales bacterium]